MQAKVPRLPCRSRDDILISCFFIISWNVEGASCNAEFAAYAFFFVICNYSFFCLIYCTRRQGISSCTPHHRSACISGSQKASAQDLFQKGTLNIPYSVEQIRCEVRRVLDGSLVCCFGSRKLVPLLAGCLATPAPYAQLRRYDQRFPFCC